MNIECKLEWKSSVAAHADIFYVDNIDFSKDKFPANFAEQIKQLAEGENYSKTLAAKDLFGEAYSTEKVISFNADLFDVNFKGQHSPPLLYRFYPKAIAWQGLNAEYNDYTPFRLISNNSDNLVADCNHPLAKYYLTLTVTIFNKTPLANKKNISKGRDISKLITARGPGMQAPFEFGDAVFFKHYPFDLTKKEANESASHFNSKPLPDSAEAQQLAKLLTQLFPGYSKILDVMCENTSYLEDNYKTGLMVGLGQNETALNSNQRLDTYEVQDLNNEQILPYEANSFDDAICSFSIHSLNDPLALMQQIARVVKSGGKFVISFSGKQKSATSITLWGQLHPFERIQLVLEYFRQGDLFEELNTLSMRGLANVDQEKSSDKKASSSQLFAVWGSVK